MSTTIPSPSATSLGPVQPFRTARLLASLVVATTTVMGLLAGFFFAYACSVMVGLRLVDDRTFVATMQAVNATVRNAAFGPVFFGALVLPVVVALLALRAEAPRRAWLAVAAGLAVGSFLVTMTLNVPLNEQLALVDPGADAPTLAAARDAYEGPWTSWNLVRTVLSTAALVALVVGGRRR